jgi:hypothetical protein
MPYAINIDKTLRFHDFISDTLETISIK